jgi:hypothetical protein
MRFCAITRSPGWKQRASNLHKSSSGELGQLLFWRESALRRAKKSGRIKGLFMFSRNNFAWDSRAEEAIVGVVNVREPLARVAGAGTGGLLMTLAARVHF